jgi:hypothetical protein
MSALEIEMEAFHVFSFPIEDSLSYVKECGSRHIIIIRLCLVVKSHSVGV